MEPNSKINGDTFRIMPRESSPRTNCPVCGARLSVASLAKHVGMKACMEVKYPHLKAFRLHAARQAKLEYDRRFSKARRDALREVSVLLTTSASPVLGVTTVRVVAEPAVAPPALDQPPQPLRLRIRRPRLPPPEIIDLSGDDDAEDDNDGEEDICAIGRELPFRPVRPTTCRHKMCSECASVHVGYSVADNREVICPSCRVPLLM